jgi:hypothetical protein
LILLEVFNFCRLRKQKDYIVVKMGKHEMELAIADTQRIISMIESGMRAGKVAEILDRSESKQMKGTLIKPVNDMMNRAKMV